MKNLIFISILLFFVTFALSSKAGHYYAKLIGAENPCPGSIENYLLELHYVNDDNWDEVVFIDNTWGWNFNGAVRISGGTGGFRYVNLNINDVATVTISVHVYHMGTPGFPTYSQDVSFTLKPHSINGVTPSAISGTTSIYKDDEVQKSYSINAIKYPNGTEISQYAWIIPAGWKRSGIVSDGNTPFITSSPSISVVSDKCTGGNISVHGINNYCSGVNSNTSSITIARPWRNYPISGPSLVCSSGASFSLSSLPTGATISWDKSSNLSRNSLQGANPCTFAATGSGEGWIEATVSTSCGTITLPRKTVWTGKPLPPVITSEQWPYVWIEEPGYGLVKKYTVPVNLDIVFYDENHYGALFNNFNWTWYLDDGGKPHDDYDYGLGGKMYIFYEPGSFRVRVVCGNGCGSTSLSAPVYFDVIGEEFLLALTPNPSTSETTVSINSNTEQAKSMDSMPEWDLEVYDQGHQLKARKMKIGGKHTTLNTSGWKEGVYIVRAKYNGQVLTKKLVVKGQ